MITKIHEHHVYWKKIRAERRYLKYRAQQLGLSVQEYITLVDEAKKGLR